MPLRDRGLVTVALTCLDEGACSLNLLRLPRRVRTQEHVTGAALGLVKDPSPEIRRRAVGLLNSSTIPESDPGAGAGRGARGNPGVPPGGGPAPPPGGELA